MELRRKAVASVLTIAVLVGLAAWVSHEPPLPTSNDDGIPAAVDLRIVQERQLTQDELAQLDKIIDEALDTGEALDKIPPLPIFQKDEKDDWFARNAPSDHSLLRLGLIGVALVLLYRTITGRVLPWCGRLITRGRILMISEQLLRRQVLVGVLCGVLGLGGGYFAATRSARYEFRGGNSTNAPLWKIDTRTGETFFCRYYTRGGNIAGSECYLAEMPYWYTDRSKRSGR